MQITNKNNRGAQQLKYIQKLVYIYKTGLFIKKWKKQMKNSKQRFHILKEWQETQKSYIQDLRIIQQSIQIPLLNHKLISKDEERILFPNIKGMIDLSQNVSKCISEAISKWNPNSTVIGQNLILLHKFFMIYRQYCNNFMKGQDILKKVKLNPLAIEIQSKLKLDLQSYVIKPVQRPPKYQLLLRQYSKAIFKSHIDYSKIQLAIQKYHEVNQLNNQSMDRQIRAQKMIKLDRKYGDIISSRFGRQFQKEFSGFYLNNKSQIHAFNDLILIIKYNSSQPPKRLYLDSSSFTTIKDHLKFYKNYVFVCGIDESIHIQFDKFVDAEYFRDQINLIIKKMVRKQDLRKVRMEQNQTKRKNMTKFKVIAWEHSIFEKIIYKNRLKINIIGIIKEKDQYFYVTQFKLISPYAFAQTFLLTFKKMLEIQQIITKLYKDLSLITIDSMSERIGLIQATTNKLKVVQNRSLVIQSYLNFILRCELFYKSWKDISIYLGLDPSFVNYFNSENYYCNCHLCIEMKENQNLSYYENLLISSKKHHTKVMYQSAVFKDKIMQSNSQQFGQKSIKSNNKTRQSCIFYNFNIMQNIKKADKRQSDNFTQRMLALQAETGDINYLYLQSERQFLKQSFTVKIYLLSISEEYIEIKITHDQYIRQILQEIAQKNTMSSIFDWALYLEHDNKSIKIGNDEKILQFTKKWGVDLERIDDKIQPSSFIDRNLQYLKKLGGQMLGNKKARLYLKKFIYFDPELQLQACKQNKERYDFLINQIFGRIKYENMPLQISQIIQISVFFLLKNEFEGIQYFLINLDLSYFKKILPEHYFSKIIRQQYKNELISSVKKHYQDLLTFKNQRNAIQLIFIKIFNLLKFNTQWITKYYQMYSYKETIQNKVIIGINYKSISIKEQTNKNILFEISLKHLTYRYNSFEIMITYNDKQYAFVGNNAWNIHHLVQLYRTYYKLYPHDS